jgi:hypothetical protein
MVAAKDPFAIARLSVRPLKKNETPGAWNQ